MSPSHSRVVSLCCCLSIAACSVQPSPGTQTDGASESSSESETGEAPGESESGSESETGTEPPPCDPDACDVDCSWSADECGQPLMPGCNPDGECDCVQPQPCPPCDESACERWEDCSGPSLGWCEINVCHGSGPIWLDPPDGCEVPTPGFPSEVIDWTWIELDGLVYQGAFDCTNSTRWVWLVPGESLLLCDDLCAAFPAAETQPLMRWGVPCE